MSQSFKTFDISSLNNTQIEAILKSTVAPRPIALVSTVNKDGKVNLSPFSYFSFVSTTPPVLVFSPTLKEGGLEKNTLENLREVPELVINMVNYEIADKMYLTSGEYDKGVDEFVKAELTPEASSVVTPPSVLESPVSFECKVDQIISLGDQEGAGNLVLARILKINISESAMEPSDLPNSSKLDLVGRLGDDYYCKTTPEALFELHKDYNNTTGIGIQSLSQSIRNSNILSQKDLDMLASSASLPDSQKIDRAMNQDEVKELFLEFETERDMIKDGIHKLGKSLIAAGKTEDALATLMIVDQI
ncbi:flavin reductase family protein [Marinoscillum sp. MHG1-6]|uniref:flavin reductase family protein n=1 Tax=Marinoscillum sp. MHG1-6 TaxID=2959627 RepID=UPI0021579F87|nr:flavin reductase family protein [Marinoscillum sp. MHG1-6]